MQENGQHIEETAVRFERVLSASIDCVWNHLTASEQLARWLIPGAIEPRLRRPARSGQRPYPRRGDAMETAAAAHLYLERFRAG